MHLEVTHKTYQVPLTILQWKKLDSLDFLDDVLPKMEAIGIEGRSVEYNGHFGRFIYFRAPVEVTESDILKVLRDLLQLTPSEIEKFGKSRNTISGSCCG